MEPIKGRKSLHIRFLVQILSLFVVVGFIMALWQFFWIRDKINQSIEQISASLISSVELGMDEVQMTNEVLERQLDTQLFYATKAIARQLQGRSLEEISPAELKGLAAEFGVEGISLFVKQGGHYVVVQSTDPVDVGTTTEDWPMATEVFDAFLAGREIRFTLPGYVRENTLILPTSQSSSHAEPHLMKYAYYGAPGMDFIIDPFLSGDVIESLLTGIGPDTFIERIERGNPMILEAGVIDPEVFLMPSLDTSYYPPRKKVAYGEARLLDPADEDLFRNLLQTHEPIQRISRANGREVIQTFIPTEEGQVIYVSLDNEWRRNLRANLMMQIGVGLAMLLFIFLFTYSFFRRIILQLHKMKGQVLRMEKGDFSARIDIAPRGAGTELDDLSAGLNQMAERLGELWRKTREQAESLVLYANVFESAAEGIVISDAKGRMIRFNPAFHELTGYEARELSGQSGTLLMTEKHPRAFYRQVRREILDAGKWQGEVWARCKSGKEIPILAHVSGIRDEEGRVSHYVTVFSDMSERKQAEELLRKSETLSVIGQMAAGVAHEIRNPLTSLSGFVQLMQSGIRDDHYLEIMKAELERIELIISEYLALARPHPIEFKPQDFRQLLAHVVALAETQAVMNNITLRLSTDLELPQVDCVENQMKQVFINLLKNAIEAMPYGGEILLEARRLAPTRLLVRVVDQGVGIPADRIAKLGEPFFTTKERGTGLGLMITRKIVQEHGGAMRITSEPGKGTTVEVELPTHRERAGQVSDGDTPIL